jgi:hypothetical protein
MITGIRIEHTHRGLVLYTLYCDSYDPIVDVPQCLQTKERQRKTTASDLFELTKMGYFTPNKERV